MYSWVNNILKTMTVYFSDPIHVTVPLLGNIVVTCENDVFEDCERFRYEISTTEGIQLYYVYDLGAVKVDELKNACLEAKASVAQKRARMRG